MSRLSPRERGLAAAVGLVLLILLSLVLFRFFASTSARIRSEIRTKQLEFDAMRSLSAEKEVWIAREAWLRANHPPLANPDEAGVQLLDKVKTVARAKGVLLENPALSVPEKREGIFAVPVSVETKSTWPALIEFLSALQEPGEFIVFETANLQVDPTDPTGMRGKFRIAKWYRP